MKWLIITVRFFFKNKHHFWNTINWNNCQQNSNSWAQRLGLCFSSLKMLHKFGQYLLYIVPGVDRCWISSGIESQIAWQKKKTTKNSLITKIGVLQTTNLKIQHGNIRIFPLFCQTTCSISLDILMFLHRILKSNCPAIWINWSTLWLSNFTN